MKTLNFALIFSICFLLLGTIYTQEFQENNKIVQLDKTKITDSLLNEFDKNVQFRFESMKRFFEQNKFTDKSSNQENIYNTMAIFESKKENAKLQLTQAISDSINQWDSTLIKRIKLLDELTKEDINNLKIGNTLKLFLSTHENYKFLFEIKEKTFSGLYSIPLEKNSELADYVFLLAKRLSQEYSKTKQTLDILCTDYYTRFINEINSTYLNYRLLTELLDELSKNKKNFIVPNYNENKIIANYHEKIIDKTDTLESFAIKVLKDETDRGYIDGQLEEIRTTIDFTPIKNEFKNDSNYIEAMGALENLHKYNDTLYYLSRTFSQDFKLESDIISFIKSSNQFFPIEKKDETLIYTTYQGEKSYLLIDAFSLYSVMQEELPSLSLEYKTNNANRKKSIANYESNITRKYKSEILNINVLHAEIKLLGQKELFHSSYFPDGKKKPIHKRIYTAGTLVLNELTNAYTEEKNLTKKIQKIQKTMDFYSSMIGITKKEKKEIKELRKTIKKDLEEENLTELLLLLSR